MRALDFLGSDHSLRTVPYHGFQVGRKISSFMSNQLRMHWRLWILLEV